jgi:hypothetical protein
LTDAQLESIGVSAHFRAMKSRGVWLLATVLLTGCGQGKPDAKAQALAEARGHIDGASALVTRLSRLTEVTPPYEVATTLRTFTHEVEQWRRSHMSQRGKLTMRGITRDESAELTRRYNAVVEELKVKVEQADRRLSKRSDNRLFYAELLRMRDAMRQL